jgi:hypothetical protein
LSKQALPLGVGATQNIFRRLPAHAACRARRAFSGKVDTGFPLENAITKKEAGRFPMLLNRKAP